MREDVTTAQLAAYLNQLLGRAHNLIYMGHKAKISGIVRFYTRTYPQVFRETLPQITLAFLIFAVAAVAACAVTLRDPAFRASSAGRENDGDDRAARDVDSFDRRNEAAGGFRDHDEQSSGGFRGVCLRRYGGNRHGVDDASERPDDRRDRRGNLACGNGGAAVEFRRAAWCARVAGNFYCRRSGTGNCARDAFSGIAACGANRSREPAAARRSCCWARFRCCLSPESSKDFFRLRICPHWSKFVFAGVMFTALVVYLNMARKSRVRAGALTRAYRRFRSLISRY